MGQTIRNWRRGVNAPTAAHWRQVRGLSAVLAGVGVRIDSGIRIIDLARPDAAD